MSSLVTLLGQFLISGAMLATDEHFRIFELFNQNNERCQQCFAVIFTIFGECRYKRFIHKLRICKDTRHYKKQVFEHNSLHAPEIGMIVHKDNH